MKRILIIDDDRMVLRLLRLVFDRAGFEVETAENGRVGVLRYDRGPFDLVITDVCMPELDGYGVCEHIRETRKRSTPVVAVTGEPEMKPGAEFSLIIKKPVNVSALCESVSKLIREA